MCLSTFPATCYLTRQRFVKRHFLRAGFTSLPTHPSSHRLCRLAADPVLAEIANGQVQRIVHDAQEHGEQEVPSQDRCHEPRSSAALLNIVSRRLKHIPRRQNMDTHHLQRRASSHSSLSKGPEGRSKQRETETRRDENQEVDDVHLQSGDDEEDVQDSACDQEESCVSECQSTGVSVPRYEEDSLTKTGQEFRSSEAFCKVASG
jgi:hypothetical protein